MSRTADKTHAQKIAEIDSELAKLASPNIPDVLKKATERAIRRLTEEKSEIAKDAIRAAEVEKNAPALFAALQKRWVPLAQKSGLVYADSEGFGHCKAEGNGIRVSQRIADTDVNVTLYNPTDATLAKVLAVLASVATPTPAPSLKPAVKVSG